MGDLAEIKRWRAEQNPLRSKRMSKANLGKVDWLITALEQSQKRERELKSAMVKHAAELVRLPRDIDKRGEEYVEREDVVKIAMRLKAARAARAARDGGEVMFVACPILCGECCRDNGLELGVPCQHLGSSECNLSREKRPKDCNDFLCEKALTKLELDKDETLQEVERLREQVAQWQTFFDVCDMHKCPRADESHPGE